MVELTQENYEAAVERGRIAEATEPRAKSASYDAKSGRIIVELKNGSTFAFPVALVQFLKDASDEELAEVEVLGRGYGLHWQTLDVDFSVPGLMAGIFGTRKYMAQLAGRAKSPKKAAAARANGKKGGRPRKAAVKPQPPAKAAPRSSAGGKARAAAERRGTSR
jgi:hypothetical protein